MTSIKRTLTDINGFTLVEMIIAIIAAGIMGAFFIQFLGTALDSSHRTVDMVRDEADAEATLERIIAVYVEEMNHRPDTALATLVGTDYGSNVSMQYVRYNIINVSGTETGQMEVMPTGQVSDILRVTIDAAGNDLITLLTNSRSGSLPDIRF